MLSPDSQHEEIPHTHAYLLTGKILPERAQLSLSFGMGFTHVASNITASARISIILNQLAVWVKSEEEWDIYDLRNVVTNIVSHNLAIIGFIKGYAYNLEITRVINEKKDIDYVFGINVPYLTKEMNDEDFEKRIHFIREKTVGKAGLLLSRCLEDLISSIKRADDTAFYCYRAIEALRHHCALTYNIPKDDKSQQWVKFREIAGCERDQIDCIKSAADPLRHGDPLGANADERKKLLEKTWGIVNAYLDACEVQVPANATAEAAAITE